MTHAEMECFKAVKADVNLFWLPGLWFTHRLREAQLQGRLLDSFGAQLIMKVYLSCHNHCGDARQFLKYPIELTTGIFGISFQMRHSLALRLGLNSVGYFRFINTLFIINLEINHCLYIFSIFLQFTRR